MRSPPFTSEILRAHAYIQMNWISYYLGNHPRRVLLAVLCTLVPLLSYFLIYPLEIECDVRRGFANKHGHAVEELTKFSNFYNISVGGLEIWGVLARNKSLDDDMHINLKLLNEMDRLHEFVWNYTTEYKGETIRFRDLSTEDINYVFNYYRKLLAIEWLPGIDLSYPLASAFGHSFYLGSQFFGVNNQQISKKGPIKTAKFVALWYMSKAETFEEKQKLQAIQLGIFRKSAEGFSDLYNFEMFGDQVANSEMLRGTLTTVKLFIIGGMLMITFMAFTFNDLTLFSKCMLILGAIGSPLAATGACFAILGWLGHPFNSIMCITPFLILGIGVDDAFLLLNCWRREDKKDPTIKSAKDAENQLARVVREISPSMAITSLTNTLAFGVGFLSPTPQMSSFCLGTALAIVLDFLFEFLIFVPCMVMFYEKKRVEKPNGGEKLEKELEPPTESRFSWRGFTKWLLSTPGRALVVLLYASIFTASYLGAANMESTFDPTKTFPSDSKLVDSLLSFTTIQQEYSPLNFLSKVPDLKNETDVATFETLLHRLEYREGCYGTVGSHNMYRDYTQFLNLSNTTEKSYDRLEEFLRGRGMADKDTIKFHKENNETVVDLINFVVVCQGRPSWSERAVNVEKTRQILADFPQYNITLFDYDGTVYDLIITVKGELVKSLAITFTCMTIACFVIMPSFVAPTIASIATVSISFFLIGFLSIWGQNLDPVTMIDVIMAIGFSVDYSAHVCYHYYCARKQELYSKNEMITRVLQAVGRPVIEASLTTLLCMAPLFVVPVYMIRSFAKTVTLVTTFGLLHGLFFLPVVLYFIPLDPPKHSLPSFTPSTQPLVLQDDEEK
uniref:SSD domain-containing protein n=1 Tax=Caenorhabditis japonica TaxID=281687 RepID=A0A8R1HR87_CAEJA